MKSRLMSHVWLTLLFTLVYVILNENLNWLTVGLGIASGAVAVGLTNRILEIDYEEMFHISMRLVLTYFWIILRDAYVVGIDVIVRIFKGNVKPNYIRYRSRLNDEFLVVLLANAITMPPGAIAVDREGGEMTILTVGYEDEVFRKSTHDKIECLLAKFDSDAT